MSIIKHINKKNFKTLYKALWNESPKQIYTNFKRLINNENTSSLIELELIDSTNKSAIENLPISIDLAFNISNNALFIKGWAAAKEKISIKIIADNKNVVWEGTPTVKREDVQRSFPQKSFKKKSGFIFLIPLHQTYKYLTIESKTSSGDFVLKKFKAQSIENINEVDLARHDQYAVMQQLGKINEKYDLSNFKIKPLISIVVPIYNVKAKWLNKMVESVEAQVYENWELCLFDDKSDKKSTQKALKKFADHPKIKIGFGEQNENISVATNNAIKMASGEYIAFMDNDDEIHKSALYEVVKAINDKPNTKIIYSDEDKISLDEEYIEPYYKPKFCFDLLRSNNFICHFSVVEKQLGDKIGWLRKGYEGAQDHDLMLRLAEQTTDIVHIPKVLYHWRKLEGSTALNHGQKSYAEKAGLKAVKDHIKRTNLDANVKKGKWPGAYRCKYNIKDKPKVSIIIPFKDDVQVLEDCLTSLTQKTTYENYEVLLLSNNSKEAKTFDYLNSITQKYSNIHFKEHNVPFNYAAINNWAVKQTDGTLILFLNNDITMINKGWLTAMVEHGRREGVGAVGAKLLYPDGTIQHAGVILGIGGVAGHAFKGLQGHLSHYFMDDVVRGISACTAACLLVKRSVFETVGGFDEENLKVAFNDVDLCLKIRESGNKLIYTPYAQLYHFESKSRGYEDTPEKIKRFKSEESFMKNKWGELLTNDPFYSPKLSLKRQQYQIDLQTYFDAYLKMNNQIKSIS